MRRSLTLLALAAVAIAAGGVLQTSAPAAPLADASHARASAHPCLVATGSGDPAFGRNFTPSVQGLPSTTFVRGGMYEPLSIATPAAGGKTYMWLAPKYTWSKDGRAPTIKPR